MEPDSLRSGPRLASQMSRRAALAGAAFLAGAAVPTLMLGSRKDPNVVIPLDFGAHADGIRDDTDALAAAVEQVPAGGTLDGRGMSYGVSTLDLGYRSNITLANMALVSLGSSSDYAPVINAGADCHKLSTTSRHVEWDPEAVVRGLVLRNVHVDGSRQRHSGIGPQEDGARHGLRIVGRAESILVDGCSFTRCASDGICLWSGAGFGGRLPTSEGLKRNIRIHNTRTTDNRRHGISFDSVTDVDIDTLVSTGNGTDQGDSEGLRGCLSPQGRQFANGLSMEEHADHRRYIGRVRVVNANLVGNASHSVLTMMPAAARAHGEQFVPRSSFVFEGCRLDDGTNGQNVDLVFYPAGFSEDPGAYYQSVIVKDCMMSGQVKATGVEGMVLQGGRWGTRSSTLGALIGGWGKVDIPNETRTLWTQGGATIHS